MTKTEVSETLKSWGVQKPFKPIRSEDEGERWLLKTRRPARIVDGLLQGSEVYIDFEAKGFRVWTSQRRLANAAAAEHGLKYRKWDDSVEMRIPGNLADELLPVFGAKVKKVLSPDVVKRACQRLANGRGFRTNHQKTGTSANL